MIWMLAKRVAFRHELDGEQSSFVDFIGFGGRADPGCA